MTKTRLTKEIEKSLIAKTIAGNFKEAYGALEVPCGKWLGKGKENIDFATYAPLNQEISCYEIKINKADFNSNASLSLYGNRNYLVAPYSLAKYITDALQSHNHQVTKQWTHEKEMLFGKIGIIGYLPGTLTDIKNFYYPLPTLLSSIERDYNKRQNNLVVLRKCRVKQIHLATKVKLIESILRAGCRDATKAYLENKYL